MSHKSLIIKIGAIGDVVMALPAARWLRTQGGHISWLAGFSVSKLIREQNVVDNVHPFDERLLGQAGPSLVAACLTTQRWIHQQRFERIYLLQSDWKYLFLVPPWMWPRVVRPRSPYPLLTRFHGYEYLRLVSGIDPMSWPTATNKKMENSQKSRLVIFPGGARNHLGNDWLRRWPVESYLKLTQLATEAQVPVAVFGTKSDSWALEAFSGMTEVTVKQFEGDVTHTIQELCPSDVVLTHDSGPFHFAQLSGAYVVGLFGPTLPESRYGPDFSGETIRAPKRLPCQPCYNGRNYANCSNNQCLTTISAEQVWQQVSRHFEEQTR